MQEDAPERAPSKNLFDSEWIVVGTLLLVMASLVIIAKIQSRRIGAVLSEYSLLSSHEMCPISIVGAVKKPGTYSVYTGTELKKVIKKSHPLPSAHLKKINMEQRVEGPMQIEIEELEMIEVKIHSGFGDPIVLSVPPGTRICDLKGVVPANAGLCKKKFIGRSLLKDGDILSVDKESGRVSRRDK